MGANMGPNIADAGWQVRVIDTVLQNTYQIFDDDWYLYNILGDFGRDADQVNDEDSSRWRMKAWGQLERDAQSALIFIFRSRGGWRLD
jgi:hypothetical protein